MALNGDRSLIGLTGATGFIGSHLLKRLESEGVEYRAFRGNLLDENDLKNFFSGNQIDTVIHLAGSFAGGFDSLLEKNLLITQRLLEAGTRNGLRRIIYSSTGAVYGEPAGEESFEDDALYPNTLYGLAKCYTEEAIRFYQKNYNINYVILRFPNVYGPGNEKGVLYNFLKAIREKGEVTIAGTGEAGRNFLHVDDACEAIIKALAYKENNIFNISNPFRLSVNEIVDQLKNIYDFKVNYREQDNFLKDLLLNTDKAARLLGFKASVTEISEYIKG